MTKKIDNCTVIDIFAGAGGLTHGFIKEGFQVAAGIDADASCQYPYEANNAGSQFIHKKIEILSSNEILEFFSDDGLNILVGCAPCQPFSSYTRKNGEHDSWRLLYDFSNLIHDVQPTIVSMENVPRLATYNSGKVYKDFIRTLEDDGYTVSSYPKVYAPKYGAPQHRTRLVLFASKWGRVDLLKETHTPERYRTVRQTIGHLPEIAAGEISASDPLHRSSGLSKLNLQRIQASTPGGSWLDWDEKLRSTCHTKDSGKFYKSVYGRMGWEELAPTITTQCSGFGNGRFGHPEQDRAISLREAALLQTFPTGYEFFGPDEPHYIKTASRLIGNAVPVVLARVIAKSIRLHIRKHRSWLIDQDLSGVSPCRP